MELVLLLINDVLQVAPLSGSSLVQVVIIYQHFSQWQISYDKATCIFFVIIQMFLSSSALPYSIVCILVTPVCPRSPQGTFTHFAVSIMSWIFHVVLHIQILPKPLFSNLKKSDALVHKNHEFKTINILFSWSSFVCEKFGKSDCQGLWWCRIPCPS